MKRDYTEIKHQLEYFYLIPTDKIVSLISKELSNNKSTDPDSKLQIIFKHVFNSASLYYDFILVDGIHTLFKENPGAELRRGLCQLIYLSLQNNCILNAFFDELALQSRPVKLSAKNISIIKGNIIDIVNQNSNIHHLRGDVDSQFFNNRKGIYKKDYDKNIYTNRIISSLNVRKQQNAIFPIEILQYISPAVAFLFMEDACCKFGRSINSSSNIFDKYNTLWEKSNDKLNAYSKPIDKLIFQSEMEVIFGFSFFSHICKQIEQINKMTTSENKGLKDLEGQALLDIILQLANLPLFFGKDLLFRYICYSFLESQHVEPLYFEESAKEVAEMLPPPLPKPQQVYNGLALMNDFLQILSSLSLPVLFSLWNVVIHELIQRNILLEDIMSIYEKYLTNNFDTLIYSSDCLSDEKIVELSNECFRQRTKLHNDLLCHYLCTEEAPGNSMSKCITPNMTSPSSKGSIQQLLCRYCNIDSLKNFRAPSFFLTNNELCSYSPLSHIITSLQYHSDSYNSHSAFRIKSFLISHRKIIFDYLFSTGIHYS